MFDRVLNTPLQTLLKHYKDCGKNMNLLFLIAQTVRDRKIKTNRLNWRQENTTGSERMTVKLAA